MARRRKRSRSSGRRRRRNPVVVRHRRRARAHVRRRRGGRRIVRSHGRRRRNPFGIRASGRGIVGKITGGVVDAAWVVGGEMGTNLIAGFIPLKGGALGLVAKIAAALATSWAANKVNANAGKMALAGGLASIIRAPIKDAIDKTNSKILKGALGDDFYVPEWPGAGGSVGPYAVGAYPSMAGDDDDDAVSAYPMQ